jgi:hypothetical protein
MEPTLAADTPGFFLERLPRLKIYQLIIPLLDTDIQQPDLALGVRRVELTFGLKGDISYRLELDLWDDIDPDHPDWSLRKDHLFIRLPISKLSEIKVPMVSLPPLSAVKGLFCR